MINMKQTFKVVCLWISIVYMVCFGGVALIPGIRAWFMKYALHTQVDIGADIMTMTTFVTGFVIWNVVAILAVWLYIILTNYFNK